MTDLNIVRCDSSSCTRREILPIDLIDAPHDSDAVARALTRAGWLRIDDKQYLCGRCAYDVI